MKANIPVGRTFRDVRNTLNPFYVIQTIFNKKIQIFRGRFNIMHDVLSCSFEQTKDFLYNTASNERGYRNLVRSL